MPDDNKDEKGQGPDFTKLLESLLGKHNNDATAAIKTLLDENHSLRADKRALNGKIAELEKAQPAEGSVVLSKTEAERWEGYKALGKPDDLTKLKAEHVEMQTKLTKAERDNTLRTVAEVAEYEFDVFAELVTDDMAFEVKPVKEDGKEVKRAFITVESDGKKETHALKDYADANERWRKFKAVLEKEPEVKGTPYVKQTKGEPPKPTDQVAVERKKLAATGDYAI